jgi:hypothetical protein
MKKKTVKKLKEAIEDSLWGGSGEPGIARLTPAAVMVGILIDEGFIDSVDDVVIETLCGQNAYSYDFLEDYSKQLEKRKK